MNEQDNFSYLIDVYKESKMDEEKFIYTQSIHWDKRYKKNQKFLDNKNMHYILILHGM